MNLNLKEIQSIQSIERLEDLLKELETDEQIIDQRLEEQYLKKDAMKQDYLELGKLSPQVNLINSKSENWFYVVQNIAEKSKLASAKLVKLSEQKRELEEALNLVDQTQLLKDLKSELNLAIKREDYDLSITLIHKYLKLDYKKVASSQFYRFLKTNSEITEDSFDSIKDNVFNYLKKQMEMAIKENNFSKIQDNVHKFPLIGEHRYGLKVYSEHLKGVLDELVNEELVRNELEFSFKFKSLLEKSSKLSIESTQLINLSYGEGYAILILANLLSIINQNSISLKTWFYDAFFLKDKLQAIHSSFINNHNIQNNKLQQKNLNQNINYNLDLRELDQLLSEITIISQKTILFRRLFLNLAKQQIETLKFNNNAYIEIEEANSRYLWIQEEGICPGFQSIIEAFPVIEKYYLNLSVEKAIELDEYEEGNGNSSSIDDIFYLIKKGSFRSLMSCDLDTFRNSIITYNSCFKELLQSFLPLINPTDNSNKTSKQQTTFSLKERIININNSKISFNYLDKLILDLKEAINKTLGSSGFESEIIDAFINAVNMLLPTKTSLESLHKNSLQYLLLHLIQPKVEAFFNQVILDSNYLLEDLNTESPIHSKFKDRFTSFLNHFKTHFTEENYELFILGLCKIINNEMIRLLKSQQYNFNGIIKMEEDVDIIVQFFSNQVEDVIYNEFEPFNLLFKVLQLESKEDLQDLIQQLKMLNKSFVTIVEFKQILSLRKDIQIDPLLEAFQEIE